LTLRPLPCPPLFPYTTLFRSDPGHRTGCKRRNGADAGVYVQRKPAADAGEGTGLLLFSQPALPLAQRRDQRECRLVSPLSQRERSEEHTSELQSRFDLVCRLL